MKPAVTLLFGCVALISLTAPVQAGQGVCDRCGCDGECRRVCRLTCEMKDVAKTTYGCTCEDFCVLGPSQRCDSGCGCGHCPACRAQSWIPTAAYVKTRKLPEKKVETVKVPTYKFVVEYVCATCRSAAAR